VRVVVDTSIWSLAFRRRASDLSPGETALVRELQRLIEPGNAVLLGVVRQEVLSGIRLPEKFEKLRSDLRTIENAMLTEEDYEAGANAFNLCRSHGISGSVVDMLICGVALRHAWGVFTCDPDFAAYAKWLPLQLYVAP